MVRFYLLWVTHVLSLKPFEFKSDETSNEDAPLPETLKSAVMSKIMDKVHDLVLADRRVKVCKLAKVTGISTQRVFFIIA